MQFRDVSLVSTQELAKITRQEAIFCSHFVAYRPRAKTMERNPCSIFSRTPP